MPKLVLYLLIFTTYLMAATAHAQSSQESDIMTEIQKCHEIQEDRTRLSCYDAFATTFQSNVKGGNIIVIDKADIENKMQENFGMENREDDKLREALNLQTDDAEKPSDKELSVVITEARRLNNRKYRFYLENGQVWDQTDSAYVYLPKNKENFVIIKKASLGSFQLRVNDKGRSIRVKRIK